MLCILIAILSCLAFTPAQSKSSVNSKSSHNILNYAKKGQFPSIVSLRYLNYHVCAGSIIQENIVITGAHCFDDYLKDNSTRIKVRNWYVVSGSVSLSQGGVYYPLKSGLVHENFTGKDIVYNNIALLRTMSVIQFDSNTKPIKFLNITVDPVGKHMLLAGWSVASKDAQASDHLQVLRAKKWSQKSCISAFKKEGYDVLPSQMCTWDETIENECAMYPGGSYIYDNHLVGLSYWGLQCMSQNLDISTNVTAFLDWIEENKNILLKEK